MTLSATRTDTTSRDKPHQTGCHLADLLRAQVAAHPDAVAVRGDDDVLTFRELALRAAAVADQLRARAVRPDDRVGVFAEPSIDAVVGVWGAVLSSGAYVPLSPDYPEERLRYMIADAGVSTVVVQPALADRLRELAPAKTEVVTTASLNTAITWEGPRSADSLAYVIYTSGSTGKPKGVMIEHRSITHQLRWLRDEYGLGPGKSVLQKTQMSFDAAQWEVLAPAFGATVVTGSPGLHRDPERLMAAIHRHRVTTLQCVPTLLRTLLDAGGLADCASLVEVFSGGEALSRRLARRCLTELPGRALINLYGPTECTINSSAYAVVTADGSGSVPIGYPVRGTTYYILDDRGTPVAEGEVGELHIGGVQLARGYLGKPELTAERFVEDPHLGKLFRTGDLVCGTAEGGVSFVGRADNQVKLRGFRIELDEVRLAIEAHDWVRHAAVVVKDDPCTGFQNLVACVELDPGEAALMDQGNHGAHHQSKQSKFQVRAQLSDPGVRADADLADRPVVALPGREPTAAQRREAFARKTYRHFEGGRVGRSDLLALLSEQITATGSRATATLPLAELGAILRPFGQFRSGERLLPKYGYASPGSLYATQLFVEAADLPGLPPGTYYYHPARHELVLVGPRAGRTRVHLIGRHDAIEPVYRNNIAEVLTIEAGHMAGLFDRVLARHGLALRAAAHPPELPAEVGAASDDHYLAAFDLVPFTGADFPHVDVYVQAHPDAVEDLPAGQYRHHDGDLVRLSDEFVERKHVVAINQRVYERASLGITVVGKTPGLPGYVDLGRALQRLSMNDVGMGFMSAGYSSESGNPLPSAVQIQSILERRGLPTGPSYFFVGGRVSPQQRHDEGMKEDLVHMKGPAELIRDDLVAALPDYMIPNKVVVFDALPLTANGKVDTLALAVSPRTDVAAEDRPFIAPKTDTERRVAALWSAVMGRDSVSATDDFFAVGGNSLIAVTLVNRLNREFDVALPLQVLFESPTVEALARKLDADQSGVAPARVISLHVGGDQAPVFCWPGLGGYVMNLRALAAEVDRPFYAIQAHGINPGEQPHPTIAAMAAADLAEIRREQPAGPYALWGYSFGARVAFETAHQLEQMGERVSELILIAPGQPTVTVNGLSAVGRSADYADKVYATILFSVFAGGVDHPALPECLALARDDASFSAFVGSRFGLDPQVVRRVAAVVRHTYSSRYDFHELTGRRLRAPITVIRARSDDYSFIEDSAAYSTAPPVVAELPADHYSLLRKPAVADLARVIRDATGAGRPETPRQEAIMPHVNIKHFPVTLPEKRQAELVAAVAAAVQAAFACEEGAISIALEPVERDAWNDRVYIPEILNRRELLHKAPAY